MADRFAQRRDEPPSAGDRYARESFTFRRMKPRQIWQILIALAVLILVAVLLM